MYDIRRRGATVYPRLRNLRISKQISQTEMGKILSMSQTGYSKYETGENDIPTTILIRLAEYQNTLSETGQQQKKSQSTQDRLTFPGKISALSGQ